MFRVITDGEQFRVHNTKKSLPTGFSPADNNAHPCRGDANESAEWYKADRSLKQQNEKLLAYYLKYGDYRLDNPRWIADMNDGLAYQQVDVFTRQLFIKSLPENAPKITAWKICIAWEASRGTEFNNYLVKGELSEAVRLDTKWTIDDLMIALEVARFSEPFCEAARQIATDFQMQRDTSYFTEYAKSTHS